MKIKQVSFRMNDNLNTVTIPLKSWYEKVNVYLGLVTTAIGIDKVVVNQFPHWALGVTILGVLITLQSLLQDVLSTTS